MKKEIEETLEKVKELEKEDPLSEEDLKKSDEEFRKENEQLKKMLESEFSYKYKGKKVRISLEEENVELKKILEQMRKSQPT
ncbi:hypothetical protein D6745_03105 [Candidatus Woesearchaeota archaeon]|nr:MAG: hypothetical protein D6745_03105 [Candidatus Woesearchaeota archaeon]